MTTPKEPRLLLFHAPLLRQDMTTPRTMRDVIVALLPATAAGAWYFGLSAVLVVAAAILGAIYMATDPVTSPITPKGAWIFGIGIGVLVMLIRVFGGLPEGVMYAILLMNAATPLIDRYTQPRVFGREAESS